MHAAPRLHQTQAAVPLTPNTFQFVQGPLEGPVVEGLWSQNEGAVLTFEGSRAGPDFGKVASCFCNLYRNGEGNYWLERV